MTEPRQIVGLSFEQYAAVRAALDDGLELRAICARVGVWPEAWPLAERAWQEEVLDDLARGGSLAQDLERAMGRAQLGWSRPLPPLDLEVRAWLDFVRSPERASQPEAVLAAAQMRLPDLRRLETLWLERLAMDAALRLEVTAILNEPPGPLPVVRAERARLPAPRTS